MKLSMSLVVVLFVVGCSSSTAEPEPEPTEQSERSSVVSESEAEPLRLQGDSSPPTETDSTSAYISRSAMADTSIEMQWSNTEGAVEQRLHRIERTSDDKPASDVMTAENQIHVSQNEEYGSFTDDTVTTGTSYWYGLRALDSSGGLVAHGWHRADAVTDVEPPGPVESLTAVLENGEVLVSWTEPDENYELHSYRVLRGVDGGELESVSTTWNLAQTSFIDDEPPAGKVSYAVVSMDFHWNDSERAKIDIDLSE